VALVAPNGVGKSTLLKVLLGDLGESLTQLTLSFTLLHISGGLSRRREHLHARALQTRAEFSTHMHRATGPQRPTHCFWSFLFEKTKLECGKKLPACRQRQAHAANGLVGRRRCVANSANGTFPPGPGPPSGASLGGPTMGQIGWGGPSTGPAPFFWCSRGVSVSV